MVNDQFDLCVVGTGPSAFFTVRAYLSKKPDARVLVVEAGSKRIDFVESLSAKASDRQDFKLNPSYNIGKGGTSQLWHNVLAPLDQEDFEEKSWVEYSGWPISKSDLDPHYENVSEYFDFNYDIFQKPDGFINYDIEIDRISVDREFFEYKVFVHPQDYLRTDREFEKLEEQYSSLKLEYGTVALRFIDASFGRSILEAWDIGSDLRKLYKADKYVLCAGALNTPAILLNSDGFTSEFLPWLGKGLMDHPMGNFYQFRYKNKISAKIYSGLPISKGINIKVALKLKANLRRKLGLANSAFYLRPSFSEGFNDKTESLKNDLLTVRSKLLNFQLPLKEALSLLGNINMVAQIIQYKTGYLSGHKLTDCMFVTEQRPNKESGIFLTEEKNKYGTYNTRINWVLSESDIEEVTLAYPYIKDKLMVGNDALPTYDPNQYSWIDRLASAAHHLGTVRMSYSGDTGCVDKNLKIHTSEDIYVCDGSVFATSGNANPTMTCMALGDRLGGYLADA